jgi:hypothetical protein
MAQRVIAACAGLATDRSPLMTAAQGGLRIAENVIIDRPGVARQRPAISEASRVATSNLPRRIAAYNGTWGYVSEWDGTSTWGIRGASSGTAVTVPTGGAEPLAVATSFVQFADARKNFYWTSKIGPVKITSEADTNAELAGMHEATSGTFSVATVGAVAIANNRVRAWRWCFVKRDANGLVVRSAPSPWQSYDNTTGGTIDMNWIIPLPTYAAAGDQIELYATQTVATGSTPSDMMYLTKRYTIVAGDVTAGYATVKDARVDADLGAELYTNPTREGLLKANGRPPACGAIAQWSTCMWFGRCIGPWTSAIEIVSVTGTTSTDALEGLQRLSLAGNATSGNDTLTGFASTTSVVVGQLVTDNGIPGTTGGTIPVGTTVLSKTATTVTMSANATATGAVTARFHDVITVDSQAYYAGGSNSAGGTYPIFLVSAADPERTARDLAAVISETSSTVFAYGIEDPYAPTDIFGNATKGTIVIRSVALDDSQWAVTSTRTGALSYPVNSSGGVLVDRENRPNQLYYSKPNEPEHVPEINFVTIGSESEPIVALAPLRAALLVFKTDGIYRVTGSPPDGWRVDLLDPVLRPLRAECVDILGESAVAWTQHGVVLVDEGGVRNISEGLVSEALEPTEQRAMTYGATLYSPFVAANNNDGYVLVGVPSNATNAYASTLYCWSKNTNAWSTWDVDAYAAREQRNIRGFFIAKAPSIWELAPLRYVNAAFTGYDGEFTPSGWTYTAATPSITVTTAQRGNWTPKACDWVSVDVNGSTEYRKITSVAIDGTDYVCTLASAFSDTPGTDRAAYEGIVSRIQWQALTPGTPQLDAIWREMSIQFDWSDYTGSVGGTTASMEIGGMSNVEVDETTQAWTSTRAALLSDSARITVPRDLARCTHLYPLVETCDIGLDWRVLGVVMTYEPTSERTKR